MPETNLPVVTTVGAGTVTVTLETLVQRIVTASRRYPHQFDYADARAIIAEWVTELPTSPGRQLARAVRRYLFEAGYDPDPKLERHDTGCAVYDAIQHDTCDCGSDKLRAALTEYEATAEVARA